MKIDGKELARANLAKRMENKRDGDAAPEEVEGEIQEQGAHIKDMANLIEAIHGKDAKMAHECMMEYAKSYSKMKSE